MPHQLSVSSVVQYQVLWFEVSVDDAFGMQISEGLRHTRRVESSSGVLERTPESNMPHREKKHFLMNGNCITETVPYMALCSVCRAT